MFVGQTIVAHKKDCLARCVLDSQVPCRCWPFILLADKLNVVWIVFLWNLCAAVIYNYEFPLVFGERLILILFQAPQKQSHAIVSGNDYREFNHCIPLVGHDKSSCGQYIPLESSLQPRYFQKMDAGKPYTKYQFCHLYTR